MALNRQNKIKISYLTSAADTLKETMEFYNVSQTELPKHLNISQKHVSDILNRKKFLSTELALKIEVVTGISANLLLNLDLNYQLDILY